MGRPPFDGRYEWMSGNPEDIGGRDPDFGQVAGSLNAMIRATYPVNGVPDDVVRLLLDCAQSCRIAEERVKLLIETVSNDLNPGTAAKQYHLVVEKPRPAIDLYSKCVYATAKASMPEVFPEKPGESKMTTGSSIYDPYRCRDHGGTQEGERINAEHSATCPRCKKKKFTGHRPKETGEPRGEPPHGGSSVMPPRPPVSTEDLRGIADLLDVQLGDSYTKDPPHIQLLALAVRDIARMLYGERSDKASSKGESNEQT